MNRMYVAQLDDAWIADPTRAAAAGMPAQDRPALVTGRIEGAFWPVREEIARGVLRAAYDGANWFVVPITLAWLDAFVEEISPDRDTEYDNWAVAPARIFLHRAVENGRWSLLGVWR
jgi:hypothetical protein